MTSVPRPSTKNSLWPIFASALALAVAGFWPSFFAKLSTTPLPHHIHGWSATAWMLLVRMMAFTSLVPDFDVALYASLITLEIACAALIAWEWRSGATSRGFQHFSDWLAMTGRAGN